MKRLILWMLKYTIPGLPFMIIYWLLRLVDWALGKVGSVVRWPLERGGAAQLERQIGKERMERALEIRGAREGRTEAKSRIIQW